jgi:hypothetical protein
MDLAVALSQGGIQIFRAVWAKGFFAVFGGMAVSSPEGERK